MAFSFLFSQNAPQKLVFKIFIYIFSERTVLLTKYSCDKDNYKEYYQEYLVRPFRSFFPPQGGTLEHGENAGQGYSAGKDSDA